MIVGTGGKQVLYNAFMATLNKGDEVIIPKNSFLMYEIYSKINGANPTIVVTDFAVNTDNILKKITKKTKINIYSKSK